MKIGELARSAGVPIDTVRYYERQGLLPEPERQPSGYRRYQSADVLRLRFVHRAKALGFTLEEIRELLALSSDREDDMGSLKLVEADYAWITERLVEVAAESAQGRIVSFLEGGYDLSALGRSAVAHVRALGGY